MNVWTFGRKLALGFGLIVVLAVAMAVLAFVALRNAVSSKDAVIAVTAQNLIDAERLRTAAWEEVALTRAHLLTTQDEHAGAARAAARRFDEAVRRIRARGTTDAEADLLSDIQRARRDHQQALSEAIEARVEARPLDEVLAAFERMAEPRFADVERSVASFVTSQRRQLERGRDEASTDAAISSATVVGIGAALALLAAIIGFVLTRSLTRQIGDTVQQVRSSSSELKTTAAQQAAGAREQSTAMSQVTTTVSELLASSRQIADSARHVASLAQDTESAAGAGKDAVQSARGSVNGIQQQVEAVVQHMLDLGKRSQQAGNILEIINEHAEQTNILAINATIEAAGAGEAGRRFMVVGEEIRRLADRVGTSSREIRVLIEQIRAAVNATVMATENGSKAVAEGAMRFDALTDALERIGQGVEKTTAAAREIELSTQQQATAVEQVNVAVSNVAQATREAEAGAGQTAQTASQMLDLASDLSRFVRAQPEG